MKTFKLSVSTDFKLSIGFVCLVFAAIAAYGVMAGNVVSWTLAILCALVIVGLVRRVRWGRRWAVGLQWFLLFLGFALVMPPEAGVPVKQPFPPLETAVLRMVVVCGVALLCLHLLGRHKKAFRDAWF